VPPSRDWFMPLKSPNKFTWHCEDDYLGHSGNWDVNNKAIYTVEGLRIGLKNYSILVATCNDELETKELTKVLATQKINGNNVEVYVKMELVKGEIRWLVLAGNYFEKGTAKMAYKELEKKGYKNMAIKDLR
jgi:hypothetical protein